MWMDSADRFHTCPITELGFIRISLGKAYGASWDQTQETLSKLHARSGFQFLPDEVDGLALPETGSNDTMDAHLVILAKRHGLKLATLDMALTTKAWAAGIAVNPLPLLRQSAQ